MRLLRTCLGSWLTILLLVLAIALLTVDAERRKPLLIRTAVTVLQLTSWASDSATEVLEGWLDESDSASEGSDAHSDR
ncbi:MAG: hypothetical protein ABIP48_18500 [Planctomycetota bacterium]